MEIDDIRSQIDEIDKQLLPLFEQRLALCLAVGREKQALGRPLYDWTRELRKIRVLRESAAPETADAVAGIFKSLISLCRQYEVDVLEK